MVIGLKRAGTTHCKPQRVQANAAQETQIKINIVNYCNTIKQQRKPRRTQGNNYSRSKFHNTFS